MMTSKGNRIASLRAHAFILLLVSISCCGLCFWYGVKSSQLYDKLRNEDFHLPWEIQEELIAELAGTDGIDDQALSSNNVTGNNSTLPTVKPAIDKEEFASVEGIDTNEDKIDGHNEDDNEEDEDSKRRENEPVSGTNHRTVPYHRIIGTPIERLMVIFENCLWALKVSNYLCFATGGLGVLSSVWFMSAHCLIFEKVQTCKVIKIVTFLVYLGLVSVSSAEIVLLTNKIVLLPILRTLADTVPLEIVNNDLYDHFQQLNKTFGPIVLGNIFLVIIISSWFVARLLNIEIYNSSYDTKERSLRRV